MANYPTVSGLALGTAQFGMHYGITNSKGQPSMAEVERILAVARSAGMDLLDTAVAYGESELVLGRIGVAEWRVVSKIPPAFESEKNSLVALVEGCLKRLGINRLYGLLLHDSSKLLESGSEQLISELDKIQAAGLVQHIGVSVYSPDHLQPLIDSVPLGIVQAPLNLLDQRMLTSGWIDQLHNQGIEFHARSIFLQGLLLNSSGQLPPALERHVNRFMVLQEWLDRSDNSALGACLAFALGWPGVTQAIVGVDSAAQLQDILRAVSERAIPDASELACDELDVIDPRRWERN